MDVWSCYFLNLIILIVHGCDLVIWLTTLSDACRALGFRLAILYSTCSVAFSIHDLALTFPSSLELGLFTLLFESIPLALTLLLLLGSAS